MKTFRQAPQHLSQWEHQSGVFATRPLPSPPIGALSLPCLFLQGTVLCDIILLNFLKGADQYKAKKFEEVSWGGVGCRCMRGERTGQGVALGPGDSRSLPLLGTS